MFGNGVNNFNFLPLEKKCKDRCKHYVKIVIRNIQVNKTKKINTFTQSHEGITSSDSPEWGRITTSKLISFLRSWLDKQQLTPLSLI